MSSKVQHANTILLGLYQDDFSVREHPDSVHSLAKEVLKEDFSLTVNMDKPVLAVNQHPQKDKSVIASCMQVQDIPIFFW